MSRKALQAGVLSLAVVASGVVGGAAYAATDPATSPTYVRTTIDANIRGAAFTVSGDVKGDVRPEIVTTGFGNIGFIPGVGPVIPAAGTVQMFSNTAKNKQGGDIEYTEKTMIVSVADGITFPNKPTLADVDGDADIDVIVPGGYFFDSFIGNARGSITWWENRANGGTWIRNNIITGSSFSYHGVQFVDLDGDGIKDITTVAEDAGSPTNAFDDIIKLQFLKGNGNGTFQAPINIGNGGGSIPNVSDVNGDGRLDVVSAQYFGQVLGQPFIPSFARTPDQASFVWFEQGGDASGGLTAANFTKRTIGAAQGPSFEIRPVENFRGDGITRWIGTNHTNRNIAFPPFSLYPEPAVYEFTPGADVTLPWNAVKLTAPGAFTVTGGPGQAAPGSTTAGDLDGDGDLDLAVSGDGDRSVYWLEQKANGSFVLNQLPNAVGFGQAGGQLAVDLNRDGINEMVFSSFDQNALAFWKR